MSIYDKASLLLIPSGTKASKVYSQKPVSGDGDFTFTRSTGATRVNADGNIKKETQNLFLQSNQFDIGWSAPSGSFTSGQQGYDGTNDAWLLTASSSGGRLQLTRSDTGIHTTSAYFKKGSADGVWMRVDMSGTDANVYVNLIDGSKINSTGEIATEITDIGNGWYRVALTADWVNVVNFRIYPTNTSGSAVAGNIYLQDAQLEQGLVARDYIETTTSAVYGGITDNVPRLDYTDSSFPALLLEPQRTNLVTQSEYINTSGGWILLNASVTNNSVQSPEGLNNATKLLASSGSGNHQVNSATNSIVSGAVTASVFAKKGNTNFVRLRFSGTSGVVRGWFDLENGEVGTIDSGGVGSIIDMGEGWYKCILTETANTSTTSNNQLQIFINESDNQTSWNAGGDEYIYIYGAQLEQASYSTSYIPTFGSSVTRVVEAVVKTLGASYFPTNGISVFVDFDVTHSSVTNFADLYILTGSSAQLRLETRTFGRIYIQQGNMVTSGDNFNAYNLCPSTAKKICLTFSSTQVKAYVDGVLINTWNGSYTWDFTDLSMGMQASTAAYNNTMLFPSTLSNQEAIDLTTL